MSSGPFGRDAETGCINANYSGLAPVLRMTLAQRRLSSRISSANLCGRAADRIESYGRKGRKQFLRRSRGSMAGVIASGLVFVGGASARAVSNLAFRVKRYLINNSGYSGYPLAEYSAVIWKYTHGMLRSVCANRKRHPGCIRMSYIES